MRISKRWQVVGALALVLVVGGVAVSANDDDDDRDVEVGATARATTTTTPPEVLGDVVVRERTSDAAPGPTTATSTTTTAAPSTTVAAPAAAPATTAPPAPAPTNPVPAPTPTAAPSTTVAPDPVAVEVRRAPDSPEMSVLLMRDGSVVGSGTLRDVLRFEDLTAGVHVLQVEWDNGTVVDEETGSAISGHGAARYEIAAEPGTTVVTCSPDHCQVG